MRIQVDTGTGARSSLARLGLAAALACLLAGCAHGPVAVPMHNSLAHWLPSPNHNERKAILIVLHATEQASVEYSLHTLRTGNSGGPVSAHYLIGRNGALYQLVDDERRAWHAGSGSWGTITDINSSSIGIELDNNGDSPFPPAQIQMLLRLLEDLCARLGIPRRQVIGHADLAPTRKRDPGRFFPWQQLAAAGFGVWPAADAGPAPADFDARLALRLLGYPPEDPAAVLHAFRLHYRGIDSADPVPDAEDVRILHALVGSVPISDEPSGH